MTIMSDTGDYQEAASGNDISQLSNKPTSVDALTMTHCNEDGSSEVDNLQAPSEHCSDDALTMKATSASACDTSVCLPSATVKSQSFDAVAAETMKTASTTASQVGQSVEAVTATSSHSAGTVQSETFDERLKSSTALASKAVPEEQESLSCKIPLSS